MADIFLKLDGIDGESQDEKHPNEIEILSYSLGMSQPGSFGMGSGGGVTKVSIQDISFSKYTDKATPKLMKFCASGKHIDSGTLTARKAAGDEALEFETITLTNIIVTSIQQGGGGGSLPTESFSLNFERLKLEYTPQESDSGSGEAADTFQWDLAKNTAEF